MKALILYTEIFIILILFTTCRHATGSEGIQENNQYLKIKFNNEKPKINDEICALIYFENKKTRIDKAYFGCDSNASKIENGQIIGCGQKLWVDNDTVKICFVPTHIGTYECQGIKLLYIDSNDNYRITDTSFSFIIIDTIPKTRLF